MELQFVKNFPLRAYKENDTVKILNIRDTTSIFYWEDYVLYKLPAVVQFETNQNIGGTEPYLILKKGNSEGYYFESLKDSSKGLRVNIDSFLTRKGLKGKDFETPADTAWRLIIENSNTPNGEIVEKYVPIHPPNETMFDSIFYYYSKGLKKVDFTFSRKLDSIKHSKLSRIRVMYNERFSQEDQFVIPKREFLFDLREVIPKDPKIIKERFLYFKMQAGI